MMMLAFYIFYDFSSYTSTYLAKSGIKQALLVIAHPDDECMFFSPSLLGLSKKKIKTHVVCLSNGNDMGLGREREKELIESCKILNVFRTEVYNHEKLQDGMSIMWDLDVITALIQRYLLAHPEIDMIITFDSIGVSQHSNHIAIHSALSSKPILNSKTNTSNPIPIYRLKTVSVVWKYSFVISALFSRLHFWWFKSHGEGQYLEFMSSISEYFIGRKAMYNHKSQMVWFRHLYLITSQYMIYNELEKV